MLTFYHSPNSRSTSIRQLIHELAVGEQIETVGCCPTEWCSWR